MSQVQWTIEVSKDTDRSLRIYLASQGAAGHAELSRFIEEAVQARIFELTVEQAKATNVGVSEQDLAEIVDEAVQWARKP